MLSFNHCIEQLDMAIEQLRLGTPSFARLSLILIDNIVELMLHERCKTEVRKDDSLKAIRPQNYSTETRKRILGRYFDEKARFCYRIGRISEEERDFIFTCHNYRNDIYHSGIQYETILSSLAWHYHKLACQLIMKLDSFSNVFNPSEKLSVSVEKLMGKDKIPSSRTLEEAIQSLDSSRPAISQSLAYYLSNALIRMLDEIDDAISFIVYDDPNVNSEEEAISEIQICNQVSTLMDTPPAINGVANPESIFEVEKSVRENWKPPVDMSKISRWRERANSMRRETNDYLALRKFDQLKGEVTPFYDLALEYADYLDYRLQLEFDRVRGK